MSRHEICEIGGRILPRAVFAQKLVEITQHLRNGLFIFFSSAFKRLLHAGKLLVQHLPAQEIADVFKFFACIRGLPVIGIELRHGRRGGCRQIFKL